MISVLCVGIGGFVGASARYMLGLIPWNFSFPLITMLINFAGSVLIGMIAESSSRFNLPPNLTLFLKTGLCGGFTTFSTFSLETVTLISDGKTAMGIAYAVTSCVICTLGVCMGMLIVRLFERTY